MASRVGYRIGSVADIKNKQDLRMVLGGLSLKQYLIRNKILGYRIQQLGFRTNLCW